MSKYPIVITREELRKVNGRDNSLGSFNSVCVDQEELEGEKYDVFILGMCCGLAIKSAPYEYGGKKVERFLVTLLGEDDDHYWVQNRKTVFASEWLDSYSACFAAAKKWCKENKAKAA